MPTLEFKGKQFIYSHHHSVPFRELVIDGEKSLPVVGSRKRLGVRIPSKPDNGNGWL
jgi:adenine-specific DNA-methyltransferase